MRTLLLGISGGIAAYKAAELASLATKRGWDVHCILTEHATKFVTPLTFEGVTRHPAFADAFAAGEAIRHIELARKADVVIVAPATANVIAKLAAGLADDLLTTTVLATTSPVLVAPAMNVEMWRNPATRANIALLRSRGVVVLDPDSGDLACGEVGEGRLLDPAAILAAIEKMVLKDLAGFRVLVTAGGTREPLDPVRFIGNRSSGRMGVAMASEAARRGASVVLVSAANLDGPAGVDLVRVGTADEMSSEVLARLPELDVLVMAAAVADWRPSKPASSKLKKGLGAPVIELEPTVDILAEAGRRRTSGQFLVGFAAETNDLVANAVEKAKGKGADLVIANEAVTALDSEDNAVTVVSPDGVVATLPRQPKSALASSLWDLILPRLPRKGTAAKEGQ